jgi:hypothetical protein
MLEIEIAAAVAGLLGISVKELLGPMKKVQERRLEERLKRYQELEAVFVNRQAISDLITEYYGLGESGLGLRYSLLVNQQEIPTTIYTEQRFINLNCPPLEVAMRFLPGRQNDGLEVNILDEVRDYAPFVLKRLERLGVKVWDAPLYRLLSHGANELELTFSETRFLTWRFTSGLLSDEFVDALIEYKGVISDILTNAASALPIRSILLPDIGSLSDFNSRICSGGIGVVFAVARGAPDNDFLLPIQVRSSSVTDVRGKYAVLPKAFHQPITGDEREVNVHWTALRELYEEVFGGCEVEQTSGRLKYDWYLDECPGVKWFQDHEGAFNLEVVGYGINAMSSDYEIALLLAVRDTWYWRTFGNAMKKTWETGNIVYISTKDREQISKILTQGDWASESIFQLAEGLLRLREIEPRRVDIPEIKRVLGKTVM